MHKHFDVRVQPGFATIAMICFAILYVPIFTLVVFAFNSGTSIAKWEGFSLRWFAAAWNNSQVIESSIRSVEIAGIAAIVATAAATLAAIATTRTAPYRGLTFK